MPFIKSFSIDTQGYGAFPFNVPAIKFADDINMDKRMTIFAGDNGSGKSTLLETLALTVNVPLIGGYITERADGFEAAHELKACTTLQWYREVKKGFFFRAEDFSDFIKGVEREKEKIRGQLRELEGQVDDRIIEEMGRGMNYSLHKMKKDYGDNLQAFSHGEAYLQILQSRISGKGVYFLDEPEAALSPMKQLSLMALILEVLKNNNSQFIMATHSPILMGFPGAVLYEIEEDGIKSVSFKETAHYRITKTFLDNPDFYLRHLT